MAQELEPPMNTLWMLARKTIAELNVETDLIEGYTWTRVADTVPMNLGRPDRTVVYSGSPESTTFGLLLSDASRHVGLKHMYVCLVSREPIAGEPGAYSTVPLDWAWVSEELKTFVRQIALQAYLLKGDKAQLQLSFLIDAVRMSRLKQELEEEQERSRQRARSFRVRPLLTGKP